MMMMMKMTAALWTKQTFIIEAIINSTQYI